MGNALKLVVIKVVALAEHFQRVIPCKSVSPFVQQNLDGLLLVQAMIEQDDIPVLTPEALPERAIRHVAPADDNGHCGSALGSKRGEYERISFPSFPALVPLGSMRGAGGRQAAVAESGVSAVAADDRCGRLR
jgi:hypothetical protein